MAKTSVTLIAVALLGGCSDHEQHETNRAAADRQNALPRAPAPTPRPAPTIDPKSSEAAGQLAGAFVSMLNHRRFGEAYMLLGPGSPPRAQFEANFARYSGLHVDAGTPGDQEGAAGSIYVSVPLSISGRLDGRNASRSARLVMRRVNDVPGSTERQRRWHIERIDWSASD